MRKPLVLAAKCRTMSGMRDEAVLSDISASGCCITTRGLLESECEELAHWIADVLDNPEDSANVVRVRGEVLDLCQRFPVYGPAHA